MALALVGCFPQAKQIVKEQSIAHVAPKDRDAVFSRALATMQRRGWIIGVSDRTGGVLTSQPMDTGVKACGVLTCPSRSTLQVTIAEDGDVVVNLHREFFLAHGQNYWFVPKAEQDVRPIEAEQRDILRDVVGTTQTPRATPAVAK